MVNRDGTMKSSHNAVRRCCLHVLRVQGTCQQLKNVLMGIISNAYVFAESPKFSKFALDFS